MKGTTFEEEAKRASKDSLSLYLKRMIRLSPLMIVKVTFENPRIEEMPELTI